MDLVLEPGVKDLGSFRVRRALPSERRRMVGPAVFESGQGMDVRLHPHVEGGQGGLADARDEHFAVVLAAIAAGWAELLRMHRRGVIHDTVLHAPEQDLDLEEMTARRHRGESLD